MARTVKADWVVAGGSPGEAAHCTRCGRGLTLGASQPIDIFVAASNAFVKLHSRCKSGEYVEPIAQTPMQWAEGRDTGTSALTIWSVMTGEHSPHRSYDIPHDPDDFGRCYRLLRLFPAWRANLSAVAKTYPKWVPFVREWDAMTKLYEQEVPTGRAPRLYELMQKLKAQIVAPLILFSLGCVAWSIFFELLARSL